MLSKKNKNADLEKKRSLFLLLGLVTVLSFIYAGFELYASTDSQKPVPVFEDDFIVLVENTKPTDQTQQNTQRDPIKEQIIKTVKGVIDLKPEIKFWNDFPDDYFMDDSVEIEIFTPDPTILEPVPFVNHMPEFPGGEEAFRTYLKKELSYPDEPRSIGVEGTVLVQFVVEKDGRVTQPKVLISVYPALDEEAIRVISKCPKWNPGEHFGKKARVYMQMPIHFRLN